MIKWESGGVGVKSVGKLQEKHKLYIQFQFSQW